MKKAVSSRDVALARLCHRESARRRESRLLCRWQRSPVYRFLRIARETANETPLFAFALFLAPSGLASLFRCLILPILTDDFVLLPWGAFAGAVLSLLSFLLAAYRIPLSRVAADCLLSRLLFDTLALPRPYATGRRGIPWWLLLIAGIGLGVLSVYASPFLLLGILTAAAMLLPALEVPEVSLILVAILFPLTGLLEIPLLLLSILVLFAVISYILKLAVGKRGISLSLCDLFVLLFALTAFLTGLFTPSGVDGSFSGLAAALLAAGGYFLAANLLKTRRTILLLTRGLLLAGTVLGLAGVLERTVELSTSSFSEGSFLLHLKNGLSLITGESFAAYLVLLLPPALALLGSGRRHVVKTLPPFLLLVASLVLLFSPLAYLAMATALVFFFLAMRFPRQRITLIAFFLCALLPIGCLLLPTEWLEEAAPRLPFLGLDALLLEAAPLLSNGLLLFGTYPFGVGAGVTSVPSLYLQMMLESGFLALLFFLAAIASSLFSAPVLSKDRTLEPLRRLSVGIGAGLLSLPVLGLLENAFLDRRVLFLYFLLLGLLRAIGQTAKEERCLHPSLPAELGTASVSVRLLRGEG